MNARLLFSLAVLLTLAGCRSFERVEEDRNKPYNVIVTTRDRWPQSVPMRAKVKYDGPWFYELPVTASAKPRLQRSERISTWVPPVMMRVQWTPDYMFGDRTKVVGVLPPDSTAVEFQAQVRGGHGLPLPLWSGRLTVPVEAVATIEDAMTPVSDPQIDAAFLDGPAVFLCRRRWAGSDRAWEGWHVSLDKLPLDILLRTDLTFAVTIDVMRDGIVIASGEGWWRSRDYAGLGRHSLRGHMQDFNLLRLTGDLEALDSADADSHTWSLRVRSNPEMALRDFDSEQFWHGEVTVPLVAKELVLARKDKDWERTWSTVHPRPHPIP